MLQHPISAIFGAIALLFVSMTLYAETELELQLESSYSNNANKTAAEAEAIKERQDKISTRIKNTRINSRSSTVVDYSIEFENYNKNSQENETNLEGSASAGFKLTPNIQTNLNHSAKRLISNSSEAALSDNLENRNIFSISMDARINVTPLQVITVMPSLSTIRYSDSSDQDSDRANIDLSWIWRLQEKSRVKVNFQNSEIDYNIGANNQRYQQVTLGYERENRLLSYTAIAGINQFSNDNGSNEGPYVNFQATFDNRGHQFSINAKRQLTDTSFGDGNQNLTSSSNLDSVSTGIDQIEQDSFNLSYSSTQLCGRCTVKALAEFKDETHLNNPRNSLNEKIIEANLKYSLSNRSNLTSTVSIKKTEYKQDNINDFEEFSARLMYELSLNKTSSFGLFSEYETKNASLPPNDYTELTIGVSFIHKL